MQVYLAGPEVFLSNAIEIGHNKKQICQKYGLSGVFPLDKKIDLAGLSPQQVGFKLYEANKQTMESCQALIANMTPFRGPSADVGTAFEMGFMCGLGRPVFAYSNIEDNFSVRSLAWLEGETLEREDGRLADRFGMEVEDFGLTDNLMLDGAVLERETEIFCAPVGEATRFTELAVFEACVCTAAEQLLQN